MKPKHANILFLWYQVQKLEKKKDLTPSQDTQIDAFYDPLTVLCAQVWAALVEEHGDSFECVHIVDRNGKRRVFLSRQGNQFILNDRENSCTNPHIHPCSAPWGHCVLLKIR